MKIEVEINDLKTLLDGLNDAIIAYNNVCGALPFCCDVPSKQKGLKKLKQSEIEVRQVAIYNFYKQLEAIEKHEDKIRDDLISKYDVLKLLDEYGYVNCHNQMDYKYNNRIDEIRQRIIAIPVTKRCDGIDNFLDDEEKMRDFRKMSKESFLESYSYLTEQEYESTRTLYLDKLKSVCISVKQLYDYYGENLERCYIEHEHQEETNTDYYDLYNEEYGRTCMDGEECYIEEITDAYVFLLNVDGESDTRFVLTRKELESAIKGYTEPECFIPEKDSIYPLCIGRGTPECANCALWNDLEPDEEM